MWRYEVDNYQQADKAELKEAVRKASKAANQRLRLLEKAGYERGARTYVKEQLGRNRFRERVATMDENDLRIEYQTLRSFFAMESSTVRYNRKIEKTASEHYWAAVERGYKGSLQEFNEDIKRAFSDDESEEMDSDLIYQALIMDSLDVIDKALEYQASWRKQDARLVRYRTIEYVRGELSKRAEGGDTVD